MIQRLIPICILSSLFILACGGGEGTGYTTAAPGRCTPGSTQVCAGPGACSGAQVCSQDGTYWSECVCGTPGTGGTNPYGTGGFVSGTGGTINPPVTGGAGPQGGAGGTPQGTGGTPQGAGGGTTCVPKTCNQIALDMTGWTPGSLAYAPNGSSSTDRNFCYDVASCHTTSAPLACGWASDGCGGLIDCGSCPEDGTVSIGCGNTAKIPVPGGNTLVPGTANICGSRCALTNTETTNRGACYQWGFGPKWAWECPSSIPPVGVSNCTPVNNQPSSGTRHIWCCNPA
jgi:hypothetical protein